MRYKWIRLFWSNLTFHDAKSCRRQARGAIYGHEEGCECVYMEERDEREKVHVYDSLVGYFLLKIEHSIAISQL